MFALQATLLLSAAAAQPAPEVAQPPPRIPLTVADRSTESGPTSPLPVAVTKDGRHRLRINDIEWDTTIPGRTGLKLRLSLESRSGSGDFQPILPPEEILEIGNPAKLVYQLEDGTEMSPSSFLDDWSVLTMDLRPASVNRPAKLVRLDFCLQFVEVSAWEILEFKNLGPDDVPPTHAGPLGFSIRWSQGRASMPLAEFSMYTAQIASYRARVPLRFINSFSYLHREFTLTDARGRKATPTSTVNSIHMMEFQRPGTGVLRKVAGDSDAPFPDRTIEYVPAVLEDIAFPVTATFRLPKTYTVQELEFFFENITLPPAAP